MPSATAAKNVRRNSVAVVPPPAPSLKRLGANVKVTSTAETKKKDEIPVVKVEGDMMKRFNEAKKQVKDAEAVIAELQPHVHQYAMEKIFEHNCAPNCLKQLTSVKLQDYTVDEDTQEETAGEVTRVSFTSRYNSCDAEQVDAAFAEFSGRDINEYVAETLKATFDDKVFLDADGNFDKKVYDKFRTAIERVARELGLKNDDGTVKSPLNTRRVLITKPDFHERRFRDFDAEENFTLAKVLPNTIQCTPARTL